MFQLAVARGLDDMGWQSGFYRLIAFSNTLLYMKLMPYLASRGFWHLLIIVVLPSNIADANDL